jgi:acetoin:2,6-dichlorophenolindophenol oxidoreductase subunit alpha
MTTQELIDAHRAMVLSRAIEEFCISKSAHWYPGVGEEAVVVGTFSTLQADDLAVPHYRGALIIPWLRGRPLEEVLACVVQSRISPTGGRLYGSFAGDLPRGVVPYVTMVLGPNLALGAGAALAFKHRREKRVAVITLGDGTAGTGDFHEALNLAAVLRVPAVYVCQNNQFSISTSTHGTLAGESIADWAARYGMKSAQIDGNDVRTVYDAVSEAVATAREGGGPSFIEALTYRRTGHFGADPAVYRSTAEADRWGARDPIKIAEQALEEAGVARKELERVHATVSGDLERAAEVVGQAPALTPTDDLGLSEVFEHV